MIEKQDFGLKGWQLVESSESGMLAQVTRAVERKAWIVFFGLGAACDEYAFQTGLS